MGRETMHDNDNSDVVPSLLTGEGSRRNFMSNAAKVGGSALALSALGSGAVAAGQDDESEDASVTFENQTSNGTAVVIQSVEVSDGGFVAIHNDPLLEVDAVGSVIGVSDYLEAGTHESVTVTLFDAAGADVNESDLTETPIARPHEDTEDSNQEVYDFVSTNGEADGPYIVDGEAVTDTANVTVEMENETTGTQTTETETETAEA
jgi:hypothetical protein